ncbi:hypothetical protein MBLL_04391 [Methylobacterium bullatum]|uniref:Uncharacterized protein n=1 Tax=Methylobacterium bullatum TaxID=570505 RepID=A0A679KD94_9HYPH|nr:hypothetical protein MBLL_04391 [Methylobacterium bullatum]
MSHSALHESQFHVVPFIGSERPPLWRRQADPGAWGRHFAGPVSGKGRGHHGSASEGTSHAASGRGSKVGSSDGRSMGRKGAADTSFAEAARKIVGRDVGDRPGNLHKRVMLILDYRAMDRAFSYRREEVALAVHVDVPRHEPGVPARYDRFWLSPGWSTLPDHLFSSHPVPVRRPRFVPRMPKSKTELPGPPIFHHPGTMPRRNALRRPFVDPSRE